MENLFRISKWKVSDTSLGFTRYLYNEIDWEAKLIVIKGPKGVGKTTLMLQRMKQAFPKSGKALYLSLDHIWFANHHLLEIAEYFALHGGTHLFLDEVHKYPNWEQEVKNIYDFYPLNLVVSGSSMLNLAQSAKGDLSRRHIMYELRGLSFREYLKINKVIDWQPVSLETLFQNHVDIAAETFPSITILPWFEQYLQRGYYPFFKEKGGRFYDRIQHIIDNIIDSEIPTVSDIDLASRYKIKSFLSVLAHDNPYTLNITDLCRKLETNRNTLLKLIQLIASAGVTRNLRAKDSYAALGKPEKILFDNTNIIYAFGNENTGTVRETFFASQLSQGHKLFMPNKGDFLIDDQWTVEVGGKDKSFEQIKDMSNSYVAADDIDMDLGNKIPLWMFGLLY